MSNLDKIDRNHILLYMRGNNVDISHLNAIKSSFLNCDENGQGTISKLALFKELEENHQKFPKAFLVNLVKDI